MLEQHTCSETDRSFPAADAARASEARFREIQALCDAGQVPELHKGDVIYVDTSLYLSHGRDDFRGGLAEVIEARAARTLGTTGKCSLPTRKNCAPSSTRTGHILIRMTGRSLMSGRQRSGDRIIG